LVADFKRVLNQKMKKDLAEAETIAPKRVDHNKPRIFPNQEELLISNREE
jgi:hypothetical protein